MEALILSCFTKIPHPWRFATRGTGGRARGCSSIDIPSCNFLDITLNLGLDGEAAWKMLPSMSGKHPDKIPWVYNISTIVSIVRRTPCPYATVQHYPSLFIGPATSPFYFTPQISSHCIVTPRHTTPPPQ